MRKAQSSVSSPTWAASGGGSHGRRGNDQSKAPDPLDMTHPLLRIRVAVFRASQAEMAATAGVEQGTWSRWERGLRQPTLDALTRVRNEAARRGLAWDDRWFFEEAARAPEAIEPSPSIASVALGEGVACCPHCGERLALVALDPERSS